MVGGDLGTDRDHPVVADAEFGKLPLGLNLGDREPPALGLAHVLDLADARPELESDIAVLVLGAVRDHLALRKAQHRDRHMLAGLGKEAGHPDFLGNHPGAHGAVLLSPLPAQSLISTSTPAA